MVHALLINFNFSIKGLFEKSWPTLFSSGCDASVVITTFSYQFLSFYQFDCFLMFEEKLISICYLEQTNFDVAWAELCSLQLRLLDRPTAPHKSMIFAANNIIYYYLFLCILIIFYKHASQFFQCLFLFDSDFFRISDSSSRDNLNMKFYKNVKTYKFWLKQKEHNLLNNKQ